MELDTSVIHKTEALNTVHQRLERSTDAKVVLTNLAGTCRAKQGAKLCEARTKVVCSVDYVDLALQND